MKLADGRGLQTRQWFPNESLRNDDMNRFGAVLYQNFVNTLAMMDNSDSVSDRVIRGLLLSHDSSMTCTLSSGAAVSYSGSYLTGDSWGFLASPGDIFAVLVPDSIQIAFTNGVGQGDPRIDILQIRPTRVNVDTLTRAFKDPITGIVTTSVVPTGLNHSFEFLVSEGTPSPTPSAPATTPGWIKLAEVTIPASASSITDANIVTYELSQTWTTGSESTLYLSRTFRELNGDVTTTGNNTHTGDNNFTGALQKDGSDVVNLASNQTIAGDKNFSNKITGDISGNADGNAGSATILQTSRTIAGKTFNGSQNVTLSSLTAGDRLSGTAYNGSTAQTWTADPTNLSWTAGTTAGPQVNSSTGSNAVIPSASATASGAVTTTTQTFAGNKTLSGTVTFTGAIQPRTNPVGGVQAISGMTNYTMPRGWYQITGVGLLPRVGNGFGTTGPSGGPFGGSHVIYNNNSTNANIYWNRF